MDPSEPPVEPEPIYLVVESPIVGVVAVSLRQWRPGPQPESEEIGWTTDTDGGW